MGFNFRAHNSIFFHQNFYENILNKRRHCFFFVQKQQRNVKTGQFSVPLKKWNMVNELNRQSFYVLTEFVKLYNNSLVKIIVFA